MLSDVKGEMAISGGHAGLLTRFKSVMAEYGRVGTPSPPIALPSRSLGAVL